MTYLTIALLAVLVWRELARDMQRKAETVEARIERKQLLDRIQHPEIRQVEPGQPVEHEQPRDAAELAYIGQEVPEFVQVGTTDG